VLGENASTADNQQGSPTCVGPLNDCTPDSDFMSEVIQPELPGDRKPGQLGAWLRRNYMHSKAIEQYKQGLKLTREQREILIGLLLGDAHLETQNGGRTYRLKIEQSEAHQAYVEHLYEVFKQWVLTPPQPKEKRCQGYVSRNWWFQTVSHRTLRFYAHQFYRKGRKCVPHLIHLWLTPHALSYWFMDDGSIKSKQSKGVIFNTQGYTLGEVELKISVLEERFGLHAKSRRQKEGYQIYISGKSYERFRELIEPYLIDNMRYKLPSARQTQLPKR